MMIKNLIYNNPITALGMYIFTHISELEKTLLKVMAINAGIILFVILLNLIASKLNKSKIKPGS